MVSSYLLIHGNGRSFLYRHHALNIFLHPKLLFSNTLCSGYRAGYKRARCGVSRMTGYRIGYRTRMPMPGIPVWVGRVQGNPLGNQRLLGNRELKGLGLNDDTQTGKQRRENQNSNRFIHFDLLPSRTYKLPTTCDRVMDWPSCDCKLSTCLVFRENDEKRTNLVRKPPLAPRLSLGDSGKPASTMLTTKPCKTRGEPGMPLRIG